MRCSLYESPHLLLLQGYSQQHVSPHRGGGLSDGRGGGGQEALRWTGGGGLSDGPGWRGEHRALRWTWGSGG